MVFNLLLLLTCVFGLVIEVYSAPWTYYGEDGTDAWPGKCATGRRQSPVNIQTARVQVIRTEDLVLHDYNHNNTVLVENNGHTVNVWGFDNWNKRPSIEGGGLPAVYDLVQFHFHWAEKDTSGSEHKFGHLHYPIEAHFVHVKRGLTLKEAIKQPDGLAVLGVFFVVDNTDPGLEKLEVALKSTMKPHSNYTLHNFTMVNSLPHIHIDKWFYRYEGSLTTPGCQEAVIWTLLPDPIPITHDQMELFRSHQTEHGKEMRFNNRPVQPLNGRVVKLRQPRPSKEKDAAKKHGETTDHHLLEADSPSKDGAGRMQQAFVVLLVTTAILYFAGSCRFRQ